MPGGKQLGQREQHLAQGEDGRTRAASVTTGPPEWQFQVLENTDVEHKYTRSSEQGTSKLGPLLLGSGTL